MLNVIHSRGGQTFWMLRLSMHQHSRTPHITDALLKPTTNV